jgi:transcriptional regulator with XRE-family HTH domain
MSAPEPTRITAALNLRGLYGPEVDAACGVEEPAVDMWEAGKLVPTPNQIRRLARLTGFPVAYFYQRPVQHICHCQIFVCFGSGATHARYRS